VGTYIERGKKCKVVLFCRVSRTLKKGVLWEAREHYSFTGENGILGSWQRLENVPSPEKRETLSEND